MPRFLDCQGFAGGFSVGATLAGWTLAGKYEDPKGFGVPLLEANRAFLGDNWESQSSAPEDWEPKQAEAVIGTPPCSAFSAMTYGSSNNHGADAAINECMWNLMRFAAKCRPEAVAMESVTNAYRQGADLMEALSQELQRLTGERYFTTHVLQNNYSVGGCSMRRRYFLVLTKFPFGMERFPLEKLPTLGDAISDLRSLDIQWEQQPYRDEPTWWSQAHRSSSGFVDGHVPPANKFTQRLADLVQGPDGVSWDQGESQNDVLRRYYETHSEFPVSWQYPSSSRSGFAHLTRDKAIIARDFKVGGYSKPVCWPWDKPARVISGAGPYQIWHPNGRVATHREAARIMGFPDDWLISPLKDDRNLYLYWGKGTSVHPATWVMHWIKESMQGNPGNYTGDVFADGSRLIDVTHDWQRVRA